VPGTQPPSVDYRKFLEDVKLHGSQPTKSLASLTQAQYAMYSKFGAFLKGKNQVSFFVRAILERDIGKKLYLPKTTIQDAFRANNYKVTTDQFTALLSPLDTNRNGEVNVMQMFELLFGASEA